MSQSSISKGSERTAGSRFNLQALLIRYRQSFASQAANVIAMLVLLGWGLAVQNFTLLPHNKIDYSGEGWLNSELWLSPIETGADWHRFTLHGILYDVIWAEDRWLAVTSEGDIVAGNTSGDWNSRHKAGVLLSAIDRDTRSGRIVAVGYGKVVYSDDLGDSWSSTSLAEPVWFSDLAHNGSEWVAVGDPGIWRSSDGVNWRRASGAGVTEILYSVAAGEGKWLAGGENGLYTSDDGENWRWLENAGGENAGNVFSVAYGDGLWVASFSEGVKVSRDGTNWRSARPERAYQQKQPVEREQEALYFYSLAEHDGLWLGVSDLGIYASYDGLSWQQTSNPASTGRNMVSLAFNGERWLVVGDDLVSSGDGLQWQKAVSASPTGTLYSVWAEAEHWVAVGSGSILSSRDGLNWRAQSRPEKTGWLYDVAFNGSAWLAVGEKNILRSSDGENWQPVETLAKQGELYAIGHYNGRWVVVGESDLLTSRDGLRWQAPEGLSLEEGDYLMDVTWGAGRWVAVGDQGILVSENGEDWNWLETVETIDTLNGVAYSEAANLFVVVGNEEILVSRNGIDWQWVENNPQTDWLKGISWANGRWVAVGDADILVSENGESWTRLENLPNTGWLEAIASDAEKWLAVGDMGLFVSERSDPTAWKKASGYRTFAPPLSLLAYLLALVSALIFVRQLMKKRIGVATPDDESASNEFISDRAIHSLKEDRLNRAPVALALSKFIRNRESSKPFTLAVSGDWGSGKSSLMGMISSDLKKMGLAPVWFNAWHCQDMNLLSGLVRAMQEQGMPKPWELRGMVFRLLLLFRKIRFAHVVTAVVLALVAQYAYTLYASKTVRAEIFSRYVNQPVFFSDDIVEQLEKKSKNCPWQSLRGETFEKRRELFSDVTVNKVVNNSKPAAQKTQTPAEINITTANKNIVLNELCQHKLVSYFDEQLSTGLPYIMRVAQQKIGPSIIFVGTFLGAIASLISGLGVFGFNMRFKSTLDAAAEKDPAALSEVKQRLKDIAISLKQARCHSMVFFIDDLDRMRKEKLHELMELLNMLSSDNREAFFVLGMDYQRVVKHLEQELKNVHGTEEQKASLYLHKMVNVVFTPVAASDYESMIDKPSAVKHLENGFDNRERHKYYRVQRVVKPLDGLLGIAVLGLLALGAWKLLHTLADVDTTLMATAKQGATLQARAIEKEKPLSENRTETSGQKASQEVQRREQLKPTPREHAQSYAPRRTNPPSTNGTQDALWRWWPSVLILVVLALAPLMVIAEDWAQPGDSANLKRILRAFSRTLAGLRGTPRQFKRSTNLLRMIDLYKESTNDRLSYYMLGQLTVVYVLKMLGLDSESKQLAFWQEFESCAASNREQIVRTLTEWLKKEAEYPDPEFYQKNIESMVDRFVDDYEEWRTGDHRFDPDNIASLNRLLMAFS